jgi:enediyne biosynthesis protein E4
MTRPGIEGAFEINARLPVAQVFRPATGRPSSAEGLRYRRSATLWAGVAVLIVCGVAALAVWLRRSPPTSGAPLPVRGAASAATPPDVAFVDITRQAGIAFEHENGADGQKLLPETMGGGVVFFDYDNDGRPDLLFVDSRPWPWSRRAGHETRSRLVLYRNDGGGRFHDVTADAGLVVDIYGKGAAAADYDNDGWVDLFVTAVGANHLFRNVGGRFTDVTATAGVAGKADQWSTCAAWFDYDRDGDLDLFVCNYVRWSKTIDLQQDFRLDGIGRAYGPPRTFEGTFAYLYRNDGGGRFTDVSASAGVQVTNPATGVPMAKSLGVAPVDLDADGWPDLVVANDTVQNFVFHNERNGRFTEIGARAGIAFDAYGNSRSAMGIDAADFRNDGSLGIAIGNFANEMTALYVSQQEPLQFADEAIVAGIGPKSRGALTFGVLFFDYDLDGRLDLLTANGHIEAGIQKVQASQHYEQPPHLYWNAGATGGATFVPVTSPRSGDLLRPMVARGVAVADIDGDGDLDVVLSSVAGPPRLLRNDQQSRHHWIRLALTGSRSNRDAIGAIVEVEISADTLRRTVMPARGYLSQSELPVTIGLGDRTAVDDLRVQWPDGSVQTVRDVAIDSTTRIIQPR